jgi:Cu-Zn family superoxide dismutase
MSLVSFIAGVGAGMLFKKPSKRAQCTIHAECEENAEGVSGRIELQSLGARTLAIVTLSGLTPGAHGLHVHRCADFSNGCASTCEHYNPDGVSSHGGPLGPNRHKGDFGNIYADTSGKCTQQHIIVDTELDEIVGRAFIVHADPDDYGVGGHEDSASTGHAGARIAGGVITWAV